MDFKLSFTDKEIKEDFGFDNFNMQDFAATEAALNFAVVAYNIMSLFKQAVLQSYTLHQLKTLRHIIFAIGRYITRSVIKNTRAFIYQEKKKMHQKNVASLRMRYA